VDYLIPGILNEYSDGREHEMLEVYREYGAPECIIDIIAAGLARFGAKDVHPEYDSFQVYCAARIIERFKPNITFVHPSHVDSARHKTGVFTEDVRRAVMATDEYLGELLDAVAKAGIEDSTDIIVLSDHGQLDITRCVLPNLLLKDAGYIKDDKNGKISSWDAYVAAGGLCAHVYLCDPSDEQLYRSVYEFLSERAKSGEYGFESVLTVDEVKELYGLYGDFSFVLETDGHTGFAEGLEAPYARGTDVKDYRMAKASHGHRPEKGPQPTFFAYGPSFKSGVSIENGDILDHAPTFAKVFGLSLPDADGRAVDEIFK
jgi:predicted AlkP superfamily pyrophosphatase or phosphodiesterase